jgi:acyl-CoA synthetase (AMP-forming)/AMP-acid ligase II
VSEKDQAEITALDLSDVEHRVGQPVGGGQLWDPCSSWGLLPHWGRRLPRCSGQALLGGQATDIIKTGGANVSPREVDEVLAQYPGVKVAQTVGVPHETLGEIVVACVVPHEGVSLEAEKIRSFLRERLASYKVPRRVLFFRADEITLTGSAKIRAADLRDLAAKALAPYREELRQPQR